MLTLSHHFPTIIPILLIFSPVAHISSLTHFYRASQVWLRNPLFTSLGRPSANDYILSVLRNHFSSKIASFLSLVPSSSAPGGLEINATPLRLRHSSLTLIDKLSTETHALQDEVKSLLGSDNLSAKSMAYADRRNAWGDLKGEWEPARLLHVIETDVVAQEGGINLWLDLVHPR